MGVLKKLKEAGGIIKAETKKDWQKMKEQYPKAKKSARRTKAAASKIAKGAKKAHAEGRKTIRSFADAAPKVPDDYFDQFTRSWNLGSSVFDEAMQGPKKKRKKRKPKKKVV